VSSVALVVALSVWSGPPAASAVASPIPEPVLGPPKRWANGSGLLAVGGTLEVLSLGAGISGIVLGGSPGLVLTAWSTLPSALGGGLLVTGSWLRGRHHAWYEEPGAPDKLQRVRTARRVGWPLFGVGLGLLAGSSIALALWPFESCVDEGCAARHPAAFATVESAFVLAPLLISAGASALSWSASYSRARGHRFVLQPSLGGLRLRF
jgi:hypothetical protein